MKAELLAREPPFHRELPASTNCVLLHTRDRRLQPRDSRKKINVNRIEAADAMMFRLSAIESLAKTRYQAGGLCAEIAVSFRQKQKAGKKSPCLHVSSGTGWPRRAAFIGKFVTKTSAAFLQVCKLARAPKGLLSFTVISPCI